jgi:uncharacterized membrane protein
MLPTKFRRQLRREADLWAQSGLIDRATHDRIATKYQFSELDIESRNSLVTLLMGLGCVLIGIGVLTFVAANWQQLAREWRVVVLLSVFIAVNMLGFYLWRLGGSKQRLGQGLLLLGALMLGGNMALMGQMFHVRGELFQLFIAWAVGVVLMAYSLRITSLGILAQILMGLGYWQAYTSGLWSANSVDLDPNWTYFAFQHMSIVAVCLFLPLAYWCRSPAIFTLTGIAFLSSFSSMVPGGAEKITAINSLLSICVPSLLFWGYGNLSKWWQGNHRDKIGAFGQISQNLAVLILGSAYFGFSFISFGAADDSRAANTQLSWNLSSVSWDLGIVTVVTMLIWLYLIWQARHNSRHYPWNWTTTAIASMSLAMAVPLIAIKIDIASLYMLVPVFWILFFSLSIGLIRSGLANSDRGAFWFGLGLLSSRIMIWFLMTQNDLITKSLLFIVFGVGVVATGLWFERYVRHLRETKTR